MTANSEPRIAQRRELQRRLLLGGVGTLGLGMTATVGGVVVPAFFVPGTWIVGVGLAVLAAAGVLGITAVRADS